MEIILSYPSWFLIFCLLGGALYAFVLYYKNPVFRELNKAWVWILSVARFFTVSILAFLLLSPLIRTITREVEKPVVIIAQDNSASLVMGKDSLYFRNKYPEAYRGFIERLKGKYEVRTFSFGDKVQEGISFGYSDKLTDISAFFSEMETRFSNRNVGAVVLASDGLYNQGLNPAYSAAWLKSPVYTLALGDTTEKKDAMIKNVLHNRLAFLGNSFPVTVLVDARRLEGKSTELSIIKNGKTLFTQTINLISSPFIVSIPAQLDATEPGLQRYKAMLKTVTGEENKLNNSFEFFIDVIDSRQKILILANAPHPDVAALKQTIESNPNYEVETSLARDFSKLVNPYSLVILHQLPTPENPIKNVLENLKSLSLPVWVFGAKLKELPVGVTLSGNLNRMNDAEPVLVKNFPLFSLSDGLARYFSGMPAVQCPFGNYSVSNSASVLLSQRIGIVETRSPLMAFSQNGDMKVCFFAGEGIWKWRLRDFADHGNHELFTELVSKTVQYLSVKKDKSFFRITAARNNFYENEPIEMEAEVYNESYEPVNEPEVSIQVTSSDNRKYPFTFTKTTHAYRLNAGLLPAGEYTYEAKVKVNAKLFTQKGAFSVSPLMTEAVNTLADHRVLYQLSRKTGGEIMYPSQLDKLAELLEKSEVIKPVSRSEKKLSEILNLPWILYLLLALLSLEWFIRKRSGTY